MTIATAEKKIDAILALLKERLPVTTPLPALVVAPRYDFLATFPTPGPYSTAQGDGVSIDDVFWVEQKAYGRATVVPGGREGPYALRLHTEPGDDNVSGSGQHERCDVALRGVHERHEGDEDWWSHSILFPDDFAIPPPGHWCLVWNFHDLRNQGGQACQQLFVGEGGRMTIKGFAGQSFINDASFPTYQADAGTLIRGAYHDFTYHIKWSPTNGLFNAWIGRKKILTHVGPTLYQGYGVYAKCSLYHSAFGLPSSIIHDRIIRGKTWQSVSLTQLEGIS